MPWTALVTQGGCSSFPAVSDRNSYSLYCAELMANMKDVPSTERMVLCSQQWKLLSQKEKDAYHKKCDQVGCAKEDVWRPLGPWEYLTPTRGQSVVKRVSNTCYKLRLVC